MRASVQQPISKEKNVMARARKYYLKNNYLTLRSKVKVTRRSLRYVTHRLMVMHPHTKYNWPISKDKNVMARTRIYYLKNNYLTLRSKSHEGHYGTLHTALWSCTHIPNIIDLSGKTKKLWSGQAEEAEEKIRLKQYVSLRSKGWHNTLLSVQHIKINMLNNMSILYFFSYIKLKFIYTLYIFVL